MTVGNVAPSSEQCEANGLLFDRARWLCVEWAFCRWRGHDTEDVPRLVGSRLYLPTYAVMNMGAFVWSR
jgi:hypothetical protein